MKNKLKGGGKIVREEVIYKRDGKTVEHLIRNGNSNPRIKSPAKAKGKGKRKK
ncbi:MAG: hypothetical protein FWD92_00040 [Methanomassiliicoccaceae archaeon]|nr:hypothetical protein [Methanomassiliicoccaceae archaeon]